MNSIDFKTFYSPQRRRERKERPTFGGLRPKKNTYDVSDDLRLISLSEINKNTLCDLCDSSAAGGG
jgi:hypothetical protein